MKSLTPSTHRSFETRKRVGCEMTMVPGNNGLLKIIDQATHLDGFLNSLVHHDAPTRDNIGSMTLPLLYARGEWRWFWYGQTT